MPLRVKSIPVYNKAVLELVFAGAIWGVSFTLVKWALIDFSTSTLIFWRFLAAFLIGETFLFLLNKKEFLNSHSDILRSFPAGLSLGSALLFQTHGLNYTTATNSSFITSLYVVMIPVASIYYYKTKLHWTHFALSFLAFVGMGFLLDLPKNGFKLNSGDILTLGAAVASTFHIIYVSLGSKKVVSAFRFNTWQTLWSLVIVLPFLGYEMTTKNIQLIPEISSATSVLSILGLSIFVSLGAFYLQIRAQRILSTTTASMLCLLEGPYSFLFAAGLLGERLSPTQFVGAGLILLSSALTVYIERPQD